MPRKGYRFTDEQSRRLSESVKKAWKRASSVKRYLRARRMSSHRTKASATLSKTLKTLWGDPAFRKRHQRRASCTMRRVSRRLWKNEDYRNSKLDHLRKNAGRRTSNIQISIFRFLCRFGIKNIRLNRSVGLKFVDIAHLPSKTAFEIDGPYWHQSRSHERRRDRYLRQRGWRVRHLPAEKSSAKKILRSLREQ